MNKEETKTELVGKWDAMFEEGGFLHGLKGHVKENVAQLYECCTTKDCCKIEKEKPKKIGDSK